ncbi:MAG: 5-methyltetrahydropteroyltriglutamate--homocysteine S-methyltransferase [Burkholderiales bacterium]|jgi:5-methyltetrahydropteroyltriglutamate--homocysteine methyltransferase|nr:5-methyltetrahydropteroyltriglutamate--homocysteine S-methyltransferase [Burkholderiales bacterium]
MQTSIIGYPRIGQNRELKFWTEDYFNGKITQDELLDNAKTLRLRQLKKQHDSGITYIPSGDFSFYDHILDMSVLLGIVPKRYRDLSLNPLDTYFAMAKGYQGVAGDVKALTLRKWFNTNYHYIVPEIEDDTAIAVSDHKIFDELAHAKAHHLPTKPVITGAFTLLKLARFPGAKKARGFVDACVAAYVELLARLERLGAEWIQIDEPYLVTDLSSDDIRLFHQIYGALLKHKGTTKILLQTYFGDVRDVYQEMIALPFDGIGLDFIEGRQTLLLIERYGFPKDKTLFAGIVNGKNIWRNDYEKSLQLLRTLKHSVDDVVVSTSCSLLHVPYTVNAEPLLDETLKKRFSFAEEKLEELHTLGFLADEKDHHLHPLYRNNVALMRQIQHNVDEEVRLRVNNLKEADYIRLPDRLTRAPLQKERLNLPLLPTTTIGSFPQTKEVRQNRAAYKKGDISREQYQEKLDHFIADCVRFQETLSLDVLVHGEFERNDMVEYFGEHLSGFLFTKAAWVQSYGTRCVKPPIIFKDVRRQAPMTVDVSRYAQSLTDKPMKGMLTGPITILNWSFPREDISPEAMATQIALAIRDEVLDLERAGIKIIQIDEAALREKLPLRQSDWRQDYLGWAIPAFRLTASGVKPETQIHTHMCYSEFNDIIEDIDAMDADVISFEASRSSLSILNAIRQSGFETEVGPGVYDIHSPRVPSVDEMVTAIRAILKVIAKDKVWINPDCGLKTRGNEETALSLKNMIAATMRVRQTLED